MVASVFPHTFRLHWIVSYLMVSVPTQAMLIAIFGAGALSDFIRNGNGVELEDFQIAGLTCFIIGVILLPVAMRLNHRHRVRVGPYGIEAMDDRGTRWMIGWKQIDSVAIVRIGGVAEYPRANRRWANRLVASAREPGRRILRTRRGVCRGGSSPVPRFIFCAPRIVGQASCLSEFKRWIRTVRTGKMPVLQIPELHSHER